MSQNMREISEQDVKLIFLKYVYTNKQVLATRKDLILFAKERMGFNDMETTLFEKMLDSSLVKLNKDIYGYMDIFTLLNDQELIELAKDSFEAGLSTKEVSKLLVYRFYKKYAKCLIGGELIPFFIVKTFESIGISPHIEKETCTKEYVCDILLKYPGDIYINKHITYCNRCLVDLDVGTFAQKCIIYRMP